MKGNYNEVREEEKFLFIERLLISEHLTKNSIEYFSFAKQTNFGVALLYGVLKQFGNCLNESYSYFSELNSFKTFETQSNCFQVDIELLSSQMVSEDRLIGNSY